MGLIGQQQTWQRDYNLHRLSRFQEGSVFPRIFIPLPVDSGERFFFEFQDASMLEDDVARLPFPRFLSL